MDLVKSSLFLGAGSRRMWDAVGLLPAAGSLYLHKAQIDKDPQPSADTRPLQIKGAFSAQAAADDYLTRSTPYVPAPGKSCTSCSLPGYRRDQRIRFLSRSLSV